VFSGRPAAVLGHRQVESLPRVSEALVRTADERPFPLEVDGDYIGEFEEVTYSVVPGGLWAVS
jgi:hypothetical protein